MTHKQFSSRGGKAGRGKAKARTTKQAKAAANARWSLPRKPKKPVSPLTP